MDAPLDVDRVAQIQKELQLRETEDLLEFWQAHDEEAWTPEAFEAMRLILRERLGEEPLRPTTEYYCPECGAQIALTDQVCPTCGADVEEHDQGAAEDTKEGVAEPELSDESGKVLTPLAFAFFYHATRLPEEYASCLTVSGDDEMVIPAREPNVGDLKVRILDTEIVVNVGRDAQGRFHSASEAVEFIRDVLEDRVVFSFVDGQVEVYRISDLTVSEKMEWNNYVWSGPLRDQQAGVDWHRP